MFDTPILFLIFNRPDVTKITFERLKEIRPSKLYVAADGPRMHKAGEAELCQETREIIKNVDWPCEVKTLFREQNLGCGKAVSEAITWFFENEEAGIIIEDDCLPNISFFNYCTELLDKYKNDEKVFHIGGVNFQNGQQRGSGDYYFSAVAHVWGWASWRRAWNKYKFDIPDLDKFIAEKKLQNYFDNKTIIEHWTKTFQSIEKHETDTWDHQWTYCIYNNNGLSVIPNQNLVSNFGFGADATHTKANSQYSNLITKEFTKSLKHPESVVLDKEADFYFFKDFDRLLEHTKNSKVTLSYRIKNRLITALENFLRKNILAKPHKGKSNNILLVKPDAIGDFFICQWLFNYLDKFPDHKNCDFYLLANYRLKSYLDKNKPDFIKEVIYYDQNIHKRFKLLYGFYFGLRKYKFKAVYNLLFSRTQQIDEIVHFTGAEQKIGFKGDTANIKPEEKLITDNYYTKLFEIKNVDTEIFHESERIKLFFENILKTKIGDFIDGYLKSDNASSNAVLISPGSNEEYKKWNPLNFSQLINALHKENKDLSFKIFCGPGEESLGEIIRSNSKMATVENVNDINRLVELVREARLVISNDSAPTHIATAYGKPFVCIFNGSRYGRFLPYFNLSKEKYISVLPDKVDEEIKDNAKKLFYYNNKVDININSVPVEKVVLACKKILNSF